jgi:hypothetical protein
MMMMTVDGLDDHNDPFCFDGVWVCFHGLGPLGLGFRFSFFSLFGSSLSRIP